MRFLLCTLNYAPDFLGISKYSTERAEWLARRGHEVHVVTAPPYYPAWKIPEAYRGLRYRREIINGVTVHRCPIYVPAMPGGGKRLLHLASFALSSFPMLLWLAFSFRPQIVFSVAPPLFAAPVARLAAALCGAQSWLHVQDFEVDAAFDLGLLNGGRSRRFALWLERRLLGLFHVVSSISPQMIRLLDEKGIAKGYEMRNWVDLDTIYPLETPNAYRRALGLDASHVLALYAGNIARKQGSEILVEAAKALTGRPELRFLVAGDGPGKAQLMIEAAGLTNMFFLPLQPVAQLNDLLNAADIHLLPQRADAADLVLPSKLTGMLASGRPVVATAAAGTGVAHEIEGCGMVVPPGDGEAFAAAIAVLADDVARRKELGRAARLAAEARLGQGNVLAAFEAACRKLAQGQALT